MSGSSIGKLFCVSTFGESHGIAIGCIVDGCPPGLELSEVDIQRELDRRKPGTSRYVTQRRESDQVEILSGVFNGKTTGTPIALLIRNQDQKSKDYGNLIEVFRPGHADYTYWHKYGIRDYRGGGRSSARETACRVAAGAIAKKWLFEQHKIIIRGGLSQLGALPIEFVDWNHTQSNPFFAPNSNIVPKLETYLDEVRQALDSVGARLTIVAQNVPIGLGEPVFDRLDADIAHAMMSINAVKGVEIGDGFASVDKFGSQNNDQLDNKGFVSNHAGGILGGISSGQEIKISIAIKPTPSISRRQQSINQQAEEVELEIKGRHDPCVGIRAVPVAEAMLALVLIDHALRFKAQCS